MTEDDIRDKIRQVKQRYEIVGFSPLLDRAIFTAIKVAATDISVLVSGESGVGKEAFSKIIHFLSPRRHESFIAINGGAIPEGTIDSELFGHEKGAFTSAHDARRGYFETADGGTIFLDEIGEVPLETQSRLLRVLEYGEFIKVGSSKVQKTDVRLVAATNRDLLQEVQKGRFREDLYYRLNTVNIQIPPLRDRPEDIPLLFAKFSSDFADKYNVPPLELSQEAEAILKQFRFPGNIRQLKNLVEQISILETQRHLDGETLRQYLPEQPTSLQPTGRNFFAGGGGQEEPHSEREILYKFILDIKRDLSDLKTAMYDLLQRHNGSGEEGHYPEPDRHYSYPQTEYRRLLSAAGESPSAGTSHSQGYEQEPPAGKNGFTLPHESEPPEEGGSEASDAEEASAEGSLSLQKQERELIRKALDRYQGRRKMAAQELGISERTLYRKIKEFDLD